MTHIAAPVIVIAGLITVQLTLKGPQHGLFWIDAFNAGHAPLYGIVALAVLRLLRASVGHTRSRGLPVYVLAFGMTAALGAGAEAIQWVSKRDAELGDIVRNTTGAAAFLLARVGFSRELPLRRTRTLRATALLTGALLLSTAFLPLAATTVTLLGRNSAFPMLCCFDESWEKRLVLAQDADLQRVPPPSGWSPAPRGRVARLAFRPGQYPGLVIRSLRPDWSHYSTFVFEAYSELAFSVELVLSFHDIGHERDVYDRFNPPIMINPGMNVVRIPLESIRVAPRGREMNLSRMCGLVLFADRPDEEFVLYLDDFRLE